MPADRYRESRATATLHLVPNGYLNGPGSGQLRKGRIDAPGNGYLVTFTTWQRRLYFASFESGCLACRSLTDPRNWTRSQLLAWVLMPDHWHGLIILGADESLSGLTRRLKTNSSRCVRASLPDQQPATWAKGFHDRALCREEDLVGVARYIVLNPVRARLATSVLRYPFWDALWVRALDRTSG